MAQLQAYDKIAIAELVIWSLFFCAILPLIALGVKSYGYATPRTAMQGLCLNRIIGSALRVSTIAHPSNPGLYIAWLYFIHASAWSMVVIGFGLALRPFLFTDPEKPQMATPRVLKFVVRFFRLPMIIYGFVSWIIIVVAAATRTTYEETAGGVPNIDYSLLWKVSISLALAGLLVCLYFAYLSFRCRKSSHAFNRPMIVVLAVSIPLILLRFSYSLLIIFKSQPQSVPLYLGMALVPEVVVGMLVMGLGWAEGAALAVMEVCKRVVAPA